MFKLFKSLSRLERLIAKGAFIVFLVSAFVLAIGYFERHTAVIPANGGTYTEGVVNQPVYINPVIAGTSDADRDIISLIYSNLYDITDSISVSDNKLVWTIRLKPDIAWHDKERLTSDDILFTIEKIQDPDSRSPLQTAWQGVIPERVSELELKLTIGAPYAFFEENLKSLYIVPRHLFQDVPLANWRRSDYNLEPVGSGPYQYASFEKEPSGFISEYNLMRNEDYFGQKPKIDNMRFVFFTNESSAISAFNNARIDALGGISPQNLPLIMRPHQTFNLHPMSYYAIFLNQNANALLKDKNVRLALNYAVNGKEIIEKIFANYASEAIGPIPMSQTKTNDQALAAKYDPEKAKEILDQSKHMPGTDGTRGEIKLVVPNLKFLKDTADIIKANWEAIGIKTTVILLDPARIADDVIKARDYEAIMFGNVFSKNPDPFSFWHSSERFYPGLNLSLYNNKVADKLMETIRKDFDPDAQKSHLASLQSLIIQDIPAIFLYTPNYIYVMNNNVRGVNFTASSSPMARFENATTWFINATYQWAK